MRNRKIVRTAADQARQTDRQRDIYIRDIWQVIKCLQLQTDVRISANSDAAAISKCCIDDRATGEIGYSNWLFSLHNCCSLDMMTREAILVVRVLPLSDY